MASPRTVEVESVRFRVRDSAGAIAAVGCVLPSGNVAVEAHPRWDGGDPFLVGGSVLLSNENALDTLFAAFDESEYEIEFDDSDITFQ